MDFSEEFGSGALTVLVLDALVPMIRPIVQRVPVPNPVLEYRVFVEAVLCGLSDPPAPCLVCGNLNIMAAESLEVRSSMRCPVCRVSHHQFCFDKYIDQCTDGPRTLIAKLADHGFKATPELAKSVVGTRCLVDNRDLCCQWCSKSVCLLEELLAPNT